MPKKYNPSDIPPEFKAYREAGNDGPWNWDANAPADETNTPREQLEILAALRKIRK